MVEPIEGLPDGVLGYRIWGELSREEYDAVLKPALDAAVATGAPIRCLIQIGPAFEGMKAGAVWEDAKEGLHLLSSHDRWERTAVVTDVDWIVRTVGLLGWMAPGDVRTFTLEQGADATAWLAA